MFLTPSRIYTSDLGVEIEMKVIVLALLPA